MGRLQPVSGLIHVVSPAESATEMLPRETKRESCDLIYEPTSGVGKSLKSIDPIDFNVAV